MDAQAPARPLRHQAAEKHRPDDVRLLLVAEAPPASLDRYFYFDDVRQQDSLFFYVVQAVLAEVPTRTAKATQLMRLRHWGVFVIDLKPDPKLGDEPLDP